MGLINYEVVDDISFRQPDNVSNEITLLYPDEEDSNMDNEDFQNPLVAQLTEYEELDKLYGYVEEKPVLENGWEKIPQELT